ncbi:fimbrial chaperone protein [Kosakonia oryzendophytica]|uniref:Fimbrial chaperone protein n=1 Tax=Kosakonia oryzendophytica TaxID=1005665 RepID=A0A1C4DPE6_9ENTR|nr:molecular chaperone [Kosakonia oryzendophytica]SCC33264.1 fimbrial chaperone protein [Kosakonia oryzendophytica]
MFRDWLVRVWFALCALLLVCNEVYASVTMLGTRVVYLADAKEKSLTFNNTGEAPVLVVAWTDINNPESTPETADAPFIVMPPIFRINGQQTHVMRLKFTGKALPQDRESLFWLNFLQYPAKSDAINAESHLTLLVKSRLKIFYRPQGLSQDANKTLDVIKISKHGQSIDVKNTTAYYISVLDAFVDDGKNQKKIKNTGMIAPYSSVQWILPDHNGTHLTINAINDYGGVFSKVYSLSH